MWCQKQKKASMQILNIILSDSRAKNCAEHKQEWFHLKVERHREVSSIETPICKTILTGISHMI